MVPSFSLVSANKDVLGMLCVSANKDVLGMLLLCVFGHGLDQEPGLPPSLGKKD